MKKRNHRILTVLLCLLLLLCGCGSGKQSASSTEMAVAETMAAAEDVFAGNSDGGFRAAGALNAPAALMEEEAGTANAAEPIPSARKLIRNVSMYVETDDFDTLLDGIRRQTEALGGYTERSDISGQRTNYQGSPLPRSAYLTIRIPSPKLDTFTASVENGSNVINKSETTEDVTLQYSDIESRKKSLTIEQERIWELLEKADSLDAVITLEKRLSEIRYELESMESQLRLYDNQVDYSTVNLSIDEVTVYTPTAPETIGERIKSGFSRRISDVSEFCVNLFVAVITSSPVWLPLALLLLAVLSFLRSRKKKTKQKELPSPDSTAAPSDPTHS